MRRTVIFGDISHPRKKMFRKPWRTSASNAERIYVLRMGDRPSLTSRPGQALGESIDLAP